jgi:CheY-like chemotaxis protein
VISAAWHRIIISCQISTIQDKNLPIICHRAQMDTCEKLGEQLQDVLTHLYDPDYQPSGPLYAVTGCDPRDGPLAVQSAIIREIEDLKPALGIPPGARVRRVYDVMYHRYVLRLTQEETAELLSLSVRHLNRVQREAVHALARILWERRRARELSTDDRGEENAVWPPGEKTSGAQALDWRSQARHELASLEVSAPDTVSDVGEAINGVLELESALTSRYGVHVEAGFVQPNLAAAIPPSVLRQILVTAVGRLARHTSTGKITIYAGLEDGNIKITITGAVAAEGGLADNDLIHDILVPEDVLVEIHRDGDHVFLWVRVPSVMGKVTVLAVDDNLDMVHFYRRSTAGTRYRIVHATQGKGLFEAIEATAPDVIVLDVMLPDVDGWSLLMRLHEDPATRSIPVVICSVVREEELALSLGAALYLTKPVRPRQFIQALDQALLQAPAEAPRFPASNAATC